MHPKEPRKKTNKTHPPPGLRGKVEGVGEADEQRGLHLYRKQWTKGKTMGRESRGSSERTVDGSLVHSANDSLPTASLGPGGDVDKDKRCPSDDL